MSEGRTPATRPSPGRAPGPSPSLVAARRAGSLVAVGLVFVVAWFYRYNYADGSVVGLTDDHYFYLTRGWQMLFGDRPDRHFVDPGAPLTFLVEYWTQLAVGRGAWSEYLACTTLLAIGAAGTYVLAARASGSVLLGLLAAVFEIALGPRLYNYPKIVVYVLAVPALWAVIEWPALGRWAVLAGVTAVGFLWRHDHGVLIALVTAMTLVLSARWAWRERVVHAAVYGAMTLMLLAPYFGYLSTSGGVIRHFDAASRWAARDRARAPFALPHFDLSRAVFTERASGVDPRDPWWDQAPFSGFAANQEPWLFWVLVALPVVALIVLARSRDGGRPSWPHARLKMVAVALLAVVLDVAFLRGRLSARFADVAVPHAILVAWLLAVTFGAVRRAGVPTGRRALAATGALAAVLVTAMSALVLSSAVGDRLDEGALLEGPGKTWARAVTLTARLRAETELEAWRPRDYPGLGRLAYYLRDCTSPDDRLLISQYYPPLAPLAGRAFAGGHPDLRADFFNTTDDQVLTLARLRRESVPIVVLPIGEEAVQFTRSFPLIDRYLRDRYVGAGVRDLGGGEMFDVLVDRRAPVVRRYEPLGLPCFR